MKRTTKKTKTRLVRKRTKHMKTRRYTVGDRVRVWWPPTSNRKRTDFSGAYWPAKVIATYATGVTVKYDNHEFEDVSRKNMSPLAVPVDFGQEKTKLAEKEFCEVSNGSANHPCSWLAQILQVREGIYTVRFPFQDRRCLETFIVERVRRARVFDEVSWKWKLIKPGQDWEVGEISSPLELDLIVDKEHVLSKALAQLQGTEIVQPAIRSENIKKSRNIGDIISAAQGGSGPNSTMLSTTEKPFPTSRSLSLIFYGIRKKKQYYPIKPKRPISSYDYFFKYCLDKVRKENPKVREQKHIWELMGEQWHALPKEQRRTFEELSKSDQLRYDEEMEDYWDLEETTEEYAAAERCFIEQEEAKHEACVKQREEPYDASQLEEPHDATQGSSLLRSLANVGMVGFQPPPLTRSVARVPEVDSESRIILEGFDLVKIRASIVETLLEEAYYMLLGVWREGSERLGDAIRAYKAHVDGQSQPDWRAFFTSIFGNEVTSSLLRPSACHFP